MAKKETEQTEIIAPYELPEGWKWTRLGDVANYINGRAFKPEEWEKEGKPIIRIQNLTNSSGFVNRSTKTFEDKYFITKKDLLYAWSASLGAYLWSGEDGWLNQHIFKVVPNNDVDKMYLYYGLVRVTENLYAKAHGSGMVHVTLKPFLNTLIPLPPTLAEQKRIVSRIESMFSKLDEAKDKAQSVVDGFELRRAAILHKAFTNQLKIENVELKDEDWEEKKLEDVLIEKPRNGYSTTAVDYKTPYKTMSLSATTSGYFRPEFCKYIEADISEDSFLWLKPGDILIQRANSLDKIGTSAIYTGGEHEFIYPDLMMKLQVKESVSTKFIAYQLKTQKSMAYFRNNATGTAGNMPKINQKTVCNLPIRIPPLNFQLSIVNFLDSVLEKDRTAKEAAEQVLEQIDLLKKSILARAFRGEL